MSWTRKIATYVDIQSYIDYLGVGWGGEDFREEI